MRITGRRGGAAGFTLVELMLVIAIIAILGSILLGAVMMLKKRAKEKQTAVVLQNLVNSIETMKADYNFTRAIGVDKDGNLLNMVDLDNIDIGKELNPKSPFFQPALTKDDVRINKRLRTYYEVHSQQVIGNEFVDPFGNPVRYRIELIDMDVDGNGQDEHYAEEYLLSPGADRSEGTDDDIRMDFPKRTFLGEDTP
ncbi:MAG: type II secretion system protein [Planctomycetes bacterium]|nr:type II secretion system protein [Planctomycetota bacterium]